MAQNSGIEFENKVFDMIERLVKSNEFMLSEPNVKVCRNAKYYSKDRESYIECEISVEKYLENPEQNKDIRPAIIVIVECKDYTNPISVDAVEEFHAKLQQIGADSTKGVMITSAGSFQKSALKFADSKGIALARILPNDQISYIMYNMLPNTFSCIFDKNSNGINIIGALTKINYFSKHGEDFFCLSGEPSLSLLLANLLK